MSEVQVVGSERPIESHHLDWSTYAHQYDAVCDRNPAYHKNIASLIAYLKHRELNEHASICDLGAGTGNFIAAMHEIMPNANYTHVDRDVEMNRLAASKYANLKDAKVNIVQDHVQRIELPQKSQDLIICVNCLYATPPQLQLLQRVRGWLKDDGEMFIIDFGRKMKILDWNLYILRHSLKDSGFLETCRFFRRNWEFSRQNQKASLDQESGRFWLHTTREFNDLIQEAGLDVLRIEPCYRNYADLAICRPAKT